MKTGEFNLKRIVRGVAAVTVSALLISCASAPQEPESNEFRLTLLHIDDHHSNLDAKRQTLVWGEQEWQVEAGGFPRVGAQIKKLRAANENVLTLHAGDALTGSLYFTLFGLSLIHI